MPKYLIVATYSPEGMKGVLREGGSERRKMIADMAKNLDGELESFYYAFGSHDVYSVVDLPDNVTAAAMAIAHHRGRHGALRDHRAGHAGGDGQGRAHEDVLPPAGRLSARRAESEEIV